MTTGAKRHRLLARPGLKFRTWGSHAFTIVETLIFLTVSMGLFVAVASSIRGKQASAQFNSSVRDFESRMSDLANDVSTGYYLRTGNFHCNVTAGVISFGGPTDNLGESDLCISVGQVISFQALLSPNYTVTSLVGIKKVTVAGINRDVKSIAEAAPVVNSTYGSTTEKVSLGGVLGKMSYNNGGGDIAIMDFAYVTTFGTNSSLATGDIHVQLVPLTSVAPFTPAVTNPSGGIKICLQNGSPASKFAEILIGSNGRQLSTEINYKSTC